MSKNNDAEREPTAAELAEQFAGVKEQMSQLTQQLAESARYYGDEWSEQLRHLTKSAADSLRDHGLDPHHFAKDARRKADRLQTALVDDIREKPVLALSIAAVAAFLIGFLLRPK